MDKMYTVGDGEKERAGNAPDYYPRVWYLQKGCSVQSEKAPQTKKRVMSTSLTRS